MRTIVDTKKAKEKRELQIENYKKKYNYYRVLIFPNKYKMFFACLMYCLVFAYLLFTL